MGPSQKRVYHLRHNRSRVQLAATSASMLSAVRHQRSGPAKYRCAEAMLPMVGLEQYLARMYRSLGKIATRRMTLRVQNTATAQALDAKGAITAGYRSSALQSTK